MLVEEYLRYAWEEPTTKSFNKEDFAKQNRDDTSRDVDRLVEESNSMLQVAMLRQMAARWCTLYFIRREIGVRTKSKHIGSKQYDDEINVYVL